MRINYLLVAGLILSFLLSPAQRSIQAMSGESNPPENHIVVVHSDEDGVVLELNSPHYEITDEFIKGELFQKLSVDGASVLQEIGMVQIPVFHALIGIPPDADIKLDIQFDQAETLHGSYRLLPSQVVGAINDDLQPGKYVYPVNLSSTALDMLGTYPAAPVLIVDDAWLRDQRIVKVAFYPFQYNPHNGSLIWHRNLQVAVEFKNEDNYLSDNPLIISSADSPFDSILENVLLNYEQAKSWRGIPESIINQNGLPTPQNNQELATSIQPLYRIDIDKDGLYKLEYDDLLSAGVPVEGLDLSELHFHLSNQGRPVAVSVSDSDGIFNEGDSVLFYGQKFRGDYLANQYYADESDFYRTYSSQDIDGNTIDWSPQFDATMMEKYTDTNVYWLTIEEFPGMSMSTKGTGSGDAPLSQHYRRRIHAEQSKFWHTLHFTGVDTWFWDKIEISKPNEDPKEKPKEARSYPINLFAVATGEHTAILRGEIVATTNGDLSPDHHVRIYLNDGENLSPVAYLSWDGKSSYELVEVQFSQSLLIEGENKLDLVAYLEDGMKKELLYVNWFEIEYESEYKAEQERIWFDGEQIADTRYELSGFSNYNEQDIWLVEITDPLEPIIYWGFNYSTIEGGLDFVLSRETGDEYFEFYAGVAENISSGQIKIYDPLDLSMPADYVIITHKDFHPKAQELADYRQLDGLATMVLDFDDVINEFNYGIYHPIAIKNFIKQTLNQEMWGQLPAYVLLIGDGHWNYKSYSTYESAPIYMPPNLAWVDPWQGEVDSANLLAAVVGDDQMPDLMIARMPVNSAFELESIVNKIKTYESYPIQGWQRNFTYVADNPDDAGDFEAVAEKLITEYIDEGYLAHRIYLDDYVDSGQCESKKQCPEATRDLINNINSIGAYFVNYIGHASIDSWANEQLLVVDDVILLDNETRLPIILSSTCLDGYWIYPNKIGENEHPSLIEVLLRAKGSGAVAAFSPTGLGVSTGHEYLQDGFYQAVFDDGIDILGEASMAAKMRLFLAGVHVDLLHTFTVFGDPALKLNILHYYLHLPTLMNNAASIVLP